MRHRDRGDDAIPTVVFDLAKNDEIQEQRKKLVNIPTGSQWEYARAMAYVEATAKIPREDLSATQMARYTVALANIGDYEQAYELTGEKIYQDIDKALKGKTKQCKCKGTTSHELENGRPVQKEFSNIFVKTKVYDQMKRQFVALKQCNVCYRIFI